MSPAAPDQPLVFDLSTPPTRADVNLPDGEADVTYQREDLKEYPLRVNLPDGKHLEFPARLVSFAARSAADPTTAPPSSMDIHHYASTLDTARDHLLTAARDLGLDAARVESWHRQATTATGTTPVKSPWLRATLGYLTIEVQGRHMPATDPASTQTIVHYLLTWR